MGVAIVHSIKAQLAKRFNKKLFFLKIQLHLKIIFQGAAWRSVARLTRNVEVVSSSPIKRPPLFPLSKKHYPYCLVLVGYRNGF